MTRDTRICVARIGAAHGVRGEVKLWPFTEDPMAVIDYGPMSSKDGARQFEVVRARIAKDHLVAALKGITTREDAERVNGIELYIPREKLPPRQTKPFTSPLSRPSQASTVSSPFSFGTVKP